MTTMRRILSLWLERWPTDRLHRRRAFDRPLATVATIGSRRQLIAVDRAAAQAGLAPGMTLADARARAPEIATVEAEPLVDAEALVRLAEWCLRYSPWTAVDGADGIRLDVTGLVPLFPSERALAEDLLARLARQGFAARAAIADTLGAAWAVARFAAPAGTAAVVPAGGSRAALAGLPPAALRLAPEIVDDLRRLGLRRIDQLYPLPRAPLNARFGEAVARRLDQALGLADEPVSPHRPAAPRLERLESPEPIAEAAAIAQGLECLVQRLCRRLEGEGLGVRRLEFACYRADQRVERVAIGTSAPSRSPAHLRRLLNPRIEEIDPGPGIDGMILRALEVAPLAAGQGALAAEAPAADLTAGLVDRLANRLGAPNVLRLVPRDSHVPERAMRRVSGFEPAVGTGSWESHLPRPIRLFAPPDPVEVVAPIPDDPPVLFRWRRVAHRVRHAEGPERIAAEWWRDGRGDGIRDYYRVEDEAGRRFWLFRNGLYRPDPPPAWFLHGLFA
jgi:protein ImuB